MPVEGRRPGWEADGGPTGPRVSLIEEVAEGDARPCVRKRSCERYVCFRNTEGKLGMLDELCHAPPPPRLVLMGAHKNAACAVLYHG